MKRSGERGIYRGGENRAHFVLETKRDAALVIVVRGSAIDDDVRHPALRGQKRKRSRRMDGESGAQGHDKISFHGRLTGALKFCRIKILAKADRGRLQESAAATKWRPAMATKEFEMRLGIAAPMTGLTLDERIRAVKLDKPLGARAGDTVQTVNVLREDSSQLPGPFQSDDGVMDRVRPCRSESVSAFEFVIPMFDSRRFRAHEILEVNGLPSGPHAVRAAKVGDAAGSGDTGSGED